MKRISCYMTKLLLIGFLFSSCKKETLRNKPASEYFPNKVGNYWEYEVYDSSEVRGTYSSYPKRYNVSVSIVGSIILVDGKEATIWQYQYPWGKDTSYVRIIADTVKVYDKFRIETVRGLDFPLLIFLQPFHDKQRWDGKLLNIDSSFVTSEPSIKNYYSTFDNGFRIYRHYIGPNMEFHDNYYFTPNIGFVKLHYFDFYSAPFNIYLWQLKKYYLN